MDDDREGQAGNCCDPLEETQHTRVRARVPLACLLAMLLYPRQAASATSKSTAVEMRGDRL